MNIRKSILLLGASLVLALTINAGAQTGLPPIDWNGSISNIVSKIDESTNLFTPGEVEFRLGGVYVQKTGEAGAVLAVEKWDVFGLKNIGLGLEGITSGQRQACEFAYGAYRHPIGNVCGSLGLGGGWADIDNTWLVVAKAQLEYRFNKHIGTWTSASYGFEGNRIGGGGNPFQNSRGLVVGAGVCYAF